MRKSNLALAAFLAVGISTGGIAQDAETAAEGASEQVTEAAVSDAEPTCYLHVFPTLEGQAQTTSLLSGFGAIGAIADAAKNKDRNVSEAEYLKEALGPRFQVAALKQIDLVGELNLPEGTAVRYETPIADRKITTKVKTRLTESTAPCYAELIVTQNFYQKKAIYGRSLNNRFIFKDFRTGKDSTTLVKGRGGNGLSHFPPKTTDETEAAEEDLRQAFTANFVEYAKKFK
ncbi:hypothetical protein [Parerythrobacter aestuarii]|uniref:hypothetical protein n=1 Tax=Parerythrobacter aestuarii TaxID=3020909 RepID=UPI0024DEDCF9|nr:hypothetical protein [Parerythrobacter aestuarii]